MQNRYKMRGPDEVHVPKEVEHQEAPKRKFLSRPHYNCCSMWVNEGDNLEVYQVCHIHP